MHMWKGWLLGKSDAPLEGEERNGVRERRQVTQRLIKKKNLEKRQCLELRREPLRDIGQERRVQSLGG